MMTGMLKSKTMWFAAALALLGALEMQSALVRDLVGQENFGLVMLGISLATAILRVVTAQPLSEK